MTELNPTQGPAHLDAQKSDAGVFRRVVDGLLGTNPALSSGGVLVASDMAVTPGSGMAVLVAGGQAFIPGTDGPTSQGMYHVWNDGPTSVDLDPADASLDRVDLIAAVLVDSAYSPIVTGTPTWWTGAIDQWALVAIPGTLGSSSPPATPATAIALATVAVVHSTSVPGTITDLRGPLTHRRESYTEVTGLAKGPGIGTSTEMGSHEIADATIHIPDPGYPWIATIIASCYFGSSDTTSQYILSLRTGTDRSGSVIRAPVSGSGGGTVFCEREWSATGSADFNMTANRHSGSGVGQIYADPTNHYLAARVRPQ